jgi:tartrate-resistant acid phosphatase type 5
METGDWSRRRFLKRSFAFSAAAALTGCGSGVAPGNVAPGSPDPVTGGVAHILMVGDWGQDAPDGTFAAQSTVAAAMQKYVAAHNIDTEALLMLGDNFYGQMPGGAASTRWQTQFENMYPASVFNCPAYAIPGNHDYQMAPASKYDAELQYALGDTRWIMPSQFYTFPFPQESPMITFVALDTNMPDEPAQPLPPDPSFYTMTHTERQTQLEWATFALKQQASTPFTVVIGHHPIYSDGQHGDNATLIRDIDPLLRANNVHLYIAGHDHDMQHLEIAGHPTSFFMSGGGGENLYKLRLTESQRGPFAQEAYGFSHIQVRPDLMILRHLDTNGDLLHKFTKAPDGTVTILK